MERYVGLDAHAETCTLAVMGASGRRLTSKVVETNGQALVEAIRSIPGRVHLCLEEGTQSAWLHEILEPEVSEIVVVSPPESRGAKDDLRDAWSRAEELRVGAIRTRVYKAPKHWAGLRSAASDVPNGDAGRGTGEEPPEGGATRSRDSGDAGVYEEKSRGKWLKELPAAGHRPAAEWLGRELDELVPLREEAEDWLLKEAKAHPIIKTLSTAPGMGPLRTAQLVAIVVTPHRFRTRRQFWSYCGLAIVTRSSSDWVHGPEREVDASGGPADPRAEPEATAGAEGGLQGCGHDGDRAAPRASSSYGLRADAAVGDQAEPGQAHAGPSASPRSCCRCGSTRRCTTQSATSR